MPPTEMTSCQRLLAAINCQQPDRVPFLESVVDELVAVSLLDKPLQADYTLSELGAGSEPVLVGQLIGTINYDALELANYLELDGIGAYVFLKHGGIQRQVNGHSMITGGSIKNRAMFDLIHLPDPDDPATYAPLQQFIDRYRDSEKALFCFTNLGSDPVILGMGFETFALAIYEDRSLVEDMLELYTSWQARLVEHLCEMDFDFLWFGDDLAFKTAPYVSPRVFKQLFMPHFMKVAQKIRKPWLFHSDGNLYPILDDLLELGMNGIHPIEPGAMDLADLKRRYGGRISLAGHISVDALGRGTPAEVDELVRQAILVAAPGGGYIAGSSNSIPFYAQPENVLAMARAIKKYGKY
jgi:uroporphyrinogen decarboxylase